MGESGLWQGQSPTQRENPGTAEWCQKEEIPGRDNYKNCINGNLILDYGETTEYKTVFQSSTKK